MGNKIFVSYKFKDEDVYPLFVYSKTTVRDYVDKLEGYFEKTDNIYKGESDDEDLSKLSDDTIWEKLKGRIYDSTITIVCISPNMKENHKYDKSQWIPWEISYSLKEMTRNDRTSHSNAILAIVLPDKQNSYEYFVRNNKCNDCSCRTVHTNTLFNILKNNMFNQINKNKFNCTSPDNGAVYTGDSSYIKSVKWMDFVYNPNYYIPKAVDIKSRIKEYEIQKDV